MFGENHNNSIDISGVNELQVIDYDDRRFILFGALHLSFEGLCPETCTSDPMINFSRQEMYDKCYTGEGIIKRIIYEAEKERKYVDIFFEMNFYQDPPHLTMIKDPVDPQDVTQRAFIDCLYNKQLCPYKNARFHYADIRMGINKLSRYLGIIPNLMNIVNVINKLTITTDVEKATLSDYLLYFANSYILGIFISSGSIINTNLWLLINILFESDNYIIDVTKFLNKILFINYELLDKFASALSKKFSSPELTTVRIKNNLVKTLSNLIEKVYNWRLQPTLVTVREGKVMSRFKAQLDGLKNQGDPNVSESLQRYIYNKIGSVKVLGLHNILRVKHTYLQEYLDSKLTPEHKDKLQMKFPSNPLLHIASYTMDLYTISRMLRTFDPKNHVISSYIIIYAGRAHIDTISEYLQLMGGIMKIYHPSAKYQRCISIPVGDLL